VPPMVKAECTATAKAEAEFNAECTPPSIDVAYELSAGADAAASAEARAAFGGKVKAFANAYAGLVAKGARIEGMLRATAELPEAGATAVGDAASALIGSADVKVAFKLGCVAGELPAAKTKITGAIAKLTATGNAVASIGTAVGS
jgi:hypothetical protein